MKKFLSVTLKHLGVQNHLWLSMLHYIFVTSSLTKERNCCEVSFPQAYENVVIVMFQRTANTSGFLNYRKEFARLKDLSLTIFLFQW